LDNPAIETQTVAKARVRNIDTDKVFRIYRTVTKARVRNIDTDKVFRIYAETVA
jgi:hypothetical protein